jgi:hypothetical protein
MRPNIYRTTSTRIIMPTIQCPHCDDEIALDEGSSGLFDCPHCDKEFEWKTNSIAPPTTMTVVFVILALISGLATMSLILPSSDSASDVASDSYDPCYMSENPDCQSPEENGGTGGGITWDSLIEDMTIGLIEGIFEGVVSAIGFSVWVFASLCCGSMTIIFSLLALRGYSKDRVLFNSE